MASATGVRLTLKFNFAQQLRNCGWSEVYDTTFADLPSALSKTANLQAFMRVRCNCLGIGPLLVSATLTAYQQPAVPGAAPTRRLSAALPVPAFPVAGNAYNKAFSSEQPGYTADFSTTVLYTQLQTDTAATPVYSRNLWIAGLPDVSDQTNQNLPQEAQTVHAVEGFLNAVTNSGLVAAGRCQMAIRSIDRSGANPIKACTAWNLANNTYTVPGHGFVVNQPIIAEGCKTAVGGSAPRGRYLVATVPDVNTISLLNSATPTAPTKTGGFRAAIVTFNLIVEATQKGFTKRDKGRPFGLSVGRRVTPKIKRA